MLTGGAKILRLMTSGLEYVHGRAEVLWSTAVLHSFTICPFLPLYYPVIIALP